MRRHAAREIVVDGRHECSVCGEATTGAGPTLRHYNEAVSYVAPEPEDARSVGTAVEIALAVARRLAGAAPEVVAEETTRELYRAGLIRRRRGPRRGNLMLSEDETPREPDHAERAAGVKIPA